MIVNSVRNILTGFGASSLQGGSGTTSGAPLAGVINVSLTLLRGISVGYAKVRVSGVSGGVPSTIAGVAIYGSGGGADLPATLGGFVMPAEPAPEDGWEGCFVFPFVADYQYTSFSTNVSFDANVANATVDFEVWGNAMAGGQ